jgi:hypothetical protein
MSPFESVLRDMPDIANDAKAEVAGKLAWVGMNEIEMPVRIEDDAGGLIQSTALVTAYVNLIDPEVRGIGPGFRRKTTQPIDFEAVVALVSRFARRPQRPRPDSGGL